MVPYFFIIPYFTGYSGVAPLKPLYPVIFYVSLTLFGVMIYQSFPLLHFLCVRVDLPSFYARGMILYFSPPPSSSPSEGGGKGWGCSPLFRKEGLGEILKIPLHPPFPKGENRGIWEREGDMGKG